MRQTWRKDETLRAAKYRVMKTVNSWVRRNTSSELKFPYTEKTKNAEDIEKTAEHLIDIKHL